MTTDPKPNMPRIRQVLRQIDREPETWNQLYFGVKTDCGTAYCFAGHLAVQAGFSLTFYSGYEYDVGDDASITRIACGGNIACLAQELAGLTDGEAIDLFASLNSRAKLEEICLAIAARAGEPLWPAECDAELPVFGETCVSAEALV